MKVTEEYAPTVGRIPLSHHFINARLTNFPILVLFLQRLCVNFNSMIVVLNVTAGPAKGKSFTFEEPDCFLFGRAKDARISLASDPYVSRQHFLLEIAPPNCRISDLDSKHGTVVNGIQYGGKKPPEGNIRKASEGTVSTALKNNDEIVVGDTRMRVLISSEEQLAQGNQPTLGDARGPNEFALPTMLEPNARTIVEEPIEGAALKTHASHPLEGGHLEQPELSDSPDFPGYRLDGLLGQGGMGKVFKATDLKTGKVVAIKALIPNLAVSFQNFRAFQREIEVTRQLSHPHIVALLDLGKTKGAYYCVLEYVKGMDLRAYVKHIGGMLTIEQAAPLMLGTLKGLGAAHRQKIQVQAGGKSNTFTGVVHRDLKPENILLADNGDGTWTPKVADFGLSKSYESAGMTDMTMAGVAGTPAYWPREQITHYRYLHPATDVFSIASVFYECLTGTWARPGLQKMMDQCKLHNVSPGLPQYIRVISDNPIPPLRSKNPGVPQPVADVIDRALRETEVPVDEVEMRRILADLRYKDAGDFHDAMAGAFAKSGLAT